MADEKQHIGIIGAGKLGTTLARIALRAGFPVSISGKGDPEVTALTVNSLAPGAEVHTTAQLISCSEIIIFAIPLGKYQTLPREAFAGKLVIDAMNYWLGTDGDRPDLVDPRTSTSELVQNFLSDAYVVKAFNHIGYHDLWGDADRSGSGHHKAIALASSHKEAKEVMSDFIWQMGFDPLDIGNLAQGIRLEPGSDVFGASVDKRTLQKYVQNFASTERGECVRRKRPGLFQNYVFPREDTSL